MHWKEYISKLNIISDVPKPKHLKTKVQGFCINTKLLEIPDNVRELLNDFDYIYIRASLFDFAKKEYFGKQWTSTKFNLDKKQNTDIDERIYFMTSNVEDSVAIVFELIGSNKNVDKSIGWTLCSIFKSSTKAIKLLSSDNPDSIYLNIYKGTPRALPHLTDPIEKNTSVKLFEKFQLCLEIFTHEELKLCKDLIPENYLIHENDHLPGLLRTDPNEDPFENPELAPTKSYTIDNMNIFMEPSLEDFESALKHDIAAEKQVREKSGQKKDSENLKIVERRLRVGVHNGYQYTEENDIIHLKKASKDSDTRRLTQTTPYTEGSISNCLFAKNSVEVAFPDDNNFVIIFILEYVIAEPSLDKHQKSGFAPNVQHTYQLRWAIWAPLESSDYQLNDSFRDGLILDIHMKGGSIDAPEARMFYRPTIQIPRLNQDGVEEIIDETVNVKLSAIMKYKQIKDESETEKMVKKTITQQHSAYDNSIIDSTTLSEQHHKPKLRKQKSPEYNQEKPVDHIRSKDEGMMMPITKQPEFPTHQFPGYHIPPYPPNMYPYYTPVWPPIQIDPRFENISDYTGLEPFIVPYHDNSEMTPTARGINTSSGLRPIQLKSYSGLGLTRAVYSKIFSTGFPEIQDANGDLPFVIEPSQNEVPINFTYEEKDHRSCNEIVFQFMAFSKFNEHPMTVNQDSSIYFTFQFYRYPVIATERLYLERINDQLSDYENCTTYVLRKLDSQNNPLKNESPGTMLKYVLDPGYMKPGDAFTFLEYLSQQELHIDVWDGDSLMLIGSCGVSLRHLLRQGKPSIQVAYELDVLNQVEIEDDGFHELKGRLHLRMANLGSVSTQVANMRINARPQKGALIDATEPDMLRSSSLTGTMKLTSSPTINGNGYMSSIPASVGISGVVVRPQPAENKSRELATMLGSIGSENGTKKNGITQEDERRLERYRTIVNQLNRTNDTLGSGGDIDARIMLESRKNEKIEKERKLQTIEIYRQQQKGDIIKKILSGVIQKDVHLYPKFGVTELFEIKIKNHFNEDHNIQIEINQESICITPVTNTYELRALKAIYNVSTPSEDGLLTLDKKSGLYQVFLKSKESVIIPFKFINLFCPNLRQTIEPQSSTKPASVHHTNKMNQADIECQINFRTVFLEASKNASPRYQESKLVSIVRVIANPQPAIIDQTFRFFHPEQSFLKRLIRLPPVNMQVGSHMITDRTGDSAIKPIVRCSDPEVLVECKKVPLGTPSDVLLKVPCGPAPTTREFLVAVYLDRFALQPKQIWGCSAHSQSRVDIVAHQGQPTKLVLLLKPTSTSTDTTHRVKVFSSHPNELMVGSGQEDLFTLTPHTAYELTMNLTPLKVGNRNFQVNVIDMDQHTMVRSWVICAICREPEITKSFEVQLPLQTSGNNSSIVGGRKKISFQNAYSYMKKFYISTDRPDLLTFKDTILNIGSSETENIGIIFFPVKQRSKQKVYIFINDEDGKNEETLCLLINYI